MSKYQWNLVEIKEKQKYILARLKKKVSNEEQERLELSLISYISLLNNSGTLYTRFYNLMDKVTKYKFSLRKDAKYSEMEHKLLFQDMPFFDLDYLQVLLTLANNVAAPNNDENLEFVPLNLSNEDLIKISSDFYSQLEDTEIMELSKKLLNDETSLNITATSRDGYEDFGGITYNDYIFNKAYCTMIKNNNIFDIQVLNHEVMHGIDFYMHQKLPSKNYFGFHEIPTYTIDYLLIDYLEQLGFDSNEIEKLRYQKSNYLSSLAGLTLTQIEGQLIREKGLKISRNPSISDIFEVLTPQLKKQLLEIESGIIAYGIKQQIALDKESGMGHLKQLMKSDIPKDKRPNFSSIGLSDEVLIQLSEHYKDQNFDKKEQLGKGK